MKEIPILTVAKDQVDEDIYGHIIWPVDMCAMEGLLGIPSSGGNNPSPHHPLPKWVTVYGYKDGVFWVHQPEWWKGNLDNVWKDVDPSIEKITLNEFDCVLKRPVLPKSFHGAVTQSVAHNGWTPGKYIIRNLLRLAHPLGTAANFTNRLIESSGVSKYKSERESKCIAYIWKAR